MADEIVTDPQTTEEVESSELTAPDALETEPVKLVSGDVEVPVARIAPRDGMVSTRGPLVYGDMMCPLLVKEEDKDKRTVVTSYFDAEGQPAGKTVQRRPEQLIVHPVACPDCGIYVERHMLVLDNATGVRSCAIAINYKARGLTKELAALAPGDKVAAVDELAPEPLIPEAVAEPDAVTEQRSSGIAFDEPTIGRRK